MTTIEKTARAKTGWFRRAVMGAAFAAVGVLTLGAATTPAQAWWYGYGYHPYYAYHPHYYGWNHYHPAYWGYGWNGGWGWHGGWYHHHW
jgi:hypothetical protein